MHEPVVKPAALKPGSLIKIIAPSFVLRVYKNETIKTGANGTQTSVSINLN